MTDSALGIRVPWFIVGFVLGAIWAAIFTLSILFTALAPGTTAWAFGIVTCPSILLVALVLWGAGRG